MTYRSVDHKWYVPEYLYLTPGHQIAFDLHRSQFTKYPSETHKMHIALRLGCMPPCVMRLSLSVVFFFLGNGVSFLSYWLIYHRVGKTLYHIIGQFHHSHKLASHVPLTSLLQYIGKWLYHLLYTNMNMGLRYILHSLCIIRLNSYFTVGCLPSQFQCSSGECVSTEQTCNGHPDCLDRSDEMQICGIYYGARYL